MTDRKQNSEDIFHAAMALSDGTERRDPRGRLGDTRIRLGATMLAGAIIDPPGDGEALSAKIVEAESLLREGYELTRQTLLSTASTAAMPSNGSCACLRFLTKRVRRRI